MVDPLDYDDAVERVNTLLEAENLDGAAEYLLTLHPADSAEIMSDLDPEEQAGIFERFDAEDLASVFEQMDEEEMAEMAQHLGSEKLADVLDEMEPDMAADLLGELEPDEAKEVIDQMEEPGEVVELMSYEPDTAGGIMNAAPPSLRRFWTVEESVRFLKEHYRDESQLYYLYVLDRYEQLIGVVGLRAIILAEPEQTIEEIMSRSVISIPAGADQEEVAQLLSRYDLVALPVVDEQGRLAGIVTVDDVVDVLEEEATEDIYKLAQVGADSEIFSPIHQSIKNRLPWLIINMGTAFLAASVVSLFEDTIAKAAVLAAFMPIVAGQGGNAGTQTMTIVVRSLALQEIDPKETWQALWHEFRVGLINGVSIGLLVAGIAWYWEKNPFLGLVIGLAMLGNLVVAAVAGVIVPMTLKVLKIDPALASSIFVTTFTDIMGFFLFLGLATRFLPWLI